MNHRFFLAITLFVYTCASASAQTRSMELAPVLSGDVRAATLVDAPDMPLANTSRDPVSFTWQAAHVPASDAPEPFVATSRSFGLQVSASALDKGVVLRLDAPGAVLRVSGQRSGQVFDPDQLTIVLASGRELSARAATDQLVQRNDLEAASALVSDRGLGVRLAPELGAGQITLRYPMGQRSGRSDDQIRIEVLDRNSDAVLSLQSAADHFMQASDAAANVAWVSPSGLSKTSGFVLAPDGSRHELAFDADGEVRLATPRRAAYQAGLWEWHVQSINADGVRRDVKTVFALTAAVARLDNSATVVTQPDRIDVNLGTQVQSAGRFEVRATLMATDATGKQVPALTGATANWLEPGTAALRLSFDVASIKAMGLRAPFALRDLTLLDQSRMGVLERRADALSF